MKVNKLITKITAMLAAAVIAAPCAAFAADNIVHNGENLAAKTEFYNVDFDGMQWKAVADGRRFLHNAGGGMVYSSVGGNRIQSDANAKISKDGKSGDCAELAAGVKTAVAELGALKINSGSTYVFEADCRFTDQAEINSVLSVRATTGWVANWGATIKENKVWFGGKGVDAAPGEWHNIKMIFDADSNLTCTVDGVSVYGQPLKVACAAFDKTNIASPANGTIYMDNLRVTEYVPNLSISSAAAGKKVIAGTKASVIPSAFDGTGLTVSVYSSTNGVDYTKVGDGAQEITVKAYTQYFAARAYDKNGEFVGQSKPIKIEGYKSVAGSVLSDKNFDDGDMSGLGTSNVEVVTPLGQQSPYLKLSGTSGSYVRDESVRRVNSGRTVAGWRYYLEPGSTQYRSNGMMMIDYSTNAENVDTGEAAIYVYLGGTVKIQIGGNASNTVDTGIPAQLGHWYDVQAVIDIDAQKIQLYLDGSFAYECDAPGIKQLRYVEIQRYEAGASYVDDIKVYKEAAPVSEFAVSDIEHDMNDTTATIRPIITNDAQSRSFNCYAAVYDQQTNALLSIKSQKAELAAGETAARDFRFAAEDVERGYIKLMFWNDDMQPVLGCVKEG